MRGRIVGTGGPGACQQLGVSSSETPRLAYLFKAELWEEERQRVRSGFASNCALVVRAPGAEGRTHLFRRGVLVDALAVVRDDKGPVILAGLICDRLYDIHPRQSARGEKRERERGATITYCIDLSKLGRPLDLLIRACISGTPTSRDTIRARNQGRATRLDRQLYEREPAREVSLNKTSADRPLPVHSPSSFPPSLIVRVCFGVSGCTASGLRQLPVRTVASVASKRADENGAKWNAGGRTLTSPLAASGSPLTAIVAALSGF